MTCTAARHHILVVAGPQLEKRLNLDKPSGAAGVAAEK